MNNNEYNESKKRARAARQAKGIRKKKKAGRKKKIVLGMVAVIVLLFSIKIAAQEVKIYQLKKQEKQLTQQISDEELKTKELEEEIKNSDSKSYIEYLAKKYLGLIYPDEKVYIVDEGKNK